MEKNVTIPKNAVSAFVKSFGTGDTMTVTRVSAVAAVLTANNVGEKGAPSQNAVLRNLADAIGAALGEAATVRTGWKFANLGNYARVARAIDTLGLSVKSAPVITALYGVQNNARDTFGEFVDSLVGQGASAAERETLVVEAAQRIFGDLATARAEAAKKLAEERAANKGTKKDKAEKVAPIESIADLIAANPQTPAAFIRSLQEGLANASYSPKQWRQLADGLVEVADGIVNKLATREPVAAPVESATV